MEKRYLRICLPIAFTLFILTSVFAQEPIPDKLVDTTKVTSSPDRPNVKDQVDLIDVGLLILNKQNRRKDTVVRRPGKLYVSALPAFGYTLITGLAGTIAANVAFYTSDDEKANVSSVLTEPAYTAKHQVLLPVQANIWTPGNKFNIQTDWSYKKFPQDTYGLGGHNVPGYKIDYSHIRLYQTIFKTIRPDMFIGAGYYLDHYYNITEIDPPDTGPTDFEKYGLTPTSTSSAFTINFLYDLRRNLINPVQGYYVNFIYRNNLKFLGSDAHWQSILIDMRKYVHLTSTSKNILAFWTYNVFTLQGQPPYLAMPFTGSDTYINSGRGYVQGRFRGKNMAYFEAEYRFGILRNGLVGGVVFANVESLAEPTTGKFQSWWPATGAGLRFKLNKFSNTNVCLDYGFGLNGSRGIFVNLGEVF